jgi:hypothetical protein
MAVGLPLKTTYADGDVFSASDVNDITGTINQQLPPGLAFIKGSSFSAVSSHSVNDCFSSTYQNYKVIVNITTSSQVVLQYRLRVSGADDSSSNYTNQYLVADSSTVVAGRSTNTTGDLGQMSGGSESYFDVSVYYPNQSNMTGVFTINGSKAGNAYTRIQQSNFGPGTVFTGFTLIPTSGTITGNVRVYGLRNS